MSPGDDFSPKFLKATIKTDLSLRVGELDTHAETFFKIAGGIQTQGFDGNRSTPIFTSVNSRTASCNPLVRRAVRTVFDVHGVRNRLQPTAHFSQRVKKLRLVLERDVTFF